VVQKQLFDRAMLRALTLANPHLVYDFDDALYAPRDDDPADGKRAESRELLDAVLARAKLVIAGNAELARYAEARAARVVVVPTVVDTDLYRPSAPHRRPGGSIVVGWAGTPANLAYLEPLRQTIRDIRTTGSAAVEFRVICSRPPDWPDVDVTFRRWTPERAIDDIAEIDIGLMPLPDTPWTRGKCGFKALEHMALGRPPIASPVGVMPEIVSHGRTGFLADGPTEWRARLEQLIADPDLRAQLGHAARRDVVERYSVRANAPRLAELLASVIAPNARRRPHRSMNRAA
jgi:glycosyltransferase involved in cell wall biosynthesis